MRSSVGETEGFEVKVGLHQGSALSPFIFNIVMDVITQDLRETVPWCILYADDIHCIVCREKGGPGGEVGEVESSTGGKRNEDK